MNNKSKILWMALAATVVLLAMIFWMAGAFEDKIVPRTLAAGPEYRGDAWEVRLQPCPVYEEVAGTLQSEQSASVASQIMARIIRVHVHAGDRVAEGDLLIELDNVDLKARVAQARDQLNALQAQLRRAKLHYQRTRELHAKHSATQAALEAATAEYHSIRSQFSAARERLAEAEHALGYSEIRATFSGTVIDHFVEAGDMAAPGMRLLSVYDPQQLRIAAYVRETLASQLQPGQALQAGIDALQRQMPVVVEEIVPAADPGSRSFLIKARIEHDPRLLPGMFARIRIPLGEQRKILLPIRYVAQVGQLDVVWVLREGVVERRFVRLGQQDDGQIRVISGLAEGERLVAPDDVPHR